MENTITIHLPPRLYRRLAEQSRAQRSDPEAWVAALVARYLETDEQWRADFNALLARVQARAVDFTTTEIEADITQAAAEARELRRAGRSV